MKLIKELGSKVASLFDSLTKVDISFENRPYDFYLIFGQTDESKSPWITKNWKSDFEPFLNTLLNGSEFSKETALRVTKYKSEIRISKKEKKEFVYNTDIKLGRLRWDIKSHDKWTMPNNTDYYFQDFELWTPIWTVCEKKQISPDIFITISNESHYKNKGDIQFGYFMVVAVAKNLNIDSKPILRELSERINSRATILKTRKWGQPEKIGDWTFVNWIQDTFSNGIYKGKSIQTIDINAIEFEPIWELIYRQR
jgi:hypothetical protein